MAANELSTVAVEQNEYAENAPEYPVPETKSGVTVDPEAYMNAPSPKFLPGDTVHMAELINGARRKGTYRVYSSQYNRKGGFTEYRLMALDTKVLHNNGSWYRERDLRIDKRG